MTFAAEKNIAIVWFAKSFLQLAFTADDKNDHLSFKTKNKSDEQKTIFPLKMEQFQPTNEKQHFILHSILPENHFSDAFYRIESISHPGFFLDSYDESSDNESINSVFLSHGSQNTKKWQFINGQFRCNNGRTILVFDENDTYSLKTTNVEEFNKINENMNDFSFTSCPKLYEESVFHLCFYDGNSIPEQTPIIFYSPLYNKVITLITSGDLNSGGHWLRLEKFDPHMPSQVWIFNLTSQCDIRSSVITEQAFDYYNDGRRYLLYTHVHHGRPNQQWDYTNYKLITHEADHLTVEYDDYLKELKMREDIEIEASRIKDDDDINDISKCDIFGHSSTFLIFLSNQRTMVDYSLDLDSAYLYNILINQKSFLKNQVDYDNIFAQRGGDQNKDYTFLSFDEFRGNIFDNYQNTSDYEKDYSIVTFKDNPKTIKFRNVPISLNYRYNYYDRDLNRYNFTQIKNWKEFNCYLNDKISISSDQRIFIQDVQLSENSSVTFSLIMKGKLLSDYKKKPSYRISNDNNYRSYNDYEDSFDIYSDEENDAAVYTDDDNPNNGIVRSRGVNINFNFVQHRIKPQEEEKKDWQPIKPRFPSYMNDLQTPNNEQNNQVHNDVFLPPFLPFVGRRAGLRRFPNRNNANNNNNNQNEQNEQNDDPNIKITYFDEKDIPSNIDEQFHQLLNGSSITITKENSEQCRIIGNKLGITGMAEVANFVESFSLQFAHLSDLSEIQRELMEINESNIESLALNFSKHIQDIEYSTICWIILSVSITKPLQNDSLAKFCKILIQNQPPEFKEEFKKSIIRDFKSMHINTFFYRKIYLYCENLFSETEMRNLLKLRINRKHEIVFFYKEFPEFATNLDEIDPKELDCFVETGFNLNKLQKTIRDDDIDEFQRAFVAERINPNKHINTNSLLERIPLLRNSPTLIEYAAFYGSIKIFKYLLLQQANLNNCDKAKRTTFTFALAGGNTEIIHIIHQEQTQKKEFKVTTDILRNAIMFGQIDAFKWLITNTSQEEINKISKRNLILESILRKNINALLDLIEYICTSESICVHFAALFDNCEFVKLLYPFYFDNKFSLVCDAAVSGNVDILRFLLEKGEDDHFSTKINLDKSLKKVAIRTAIKCDNVEVFKYLATEKDYSYSNFIYACECNSLSFIKLFVSNEDSDSFVPSFDFSNVLINKCPLLIELINKKKQDTLDILLSSKYFDFKERFNNHSLFYYAVSNELFDFARKIYNSQKELYDINNENLLLENAKKPEIVRFLVSFPELNVNVKNENYESVIDILCQDDREEKSKPSIIYLLDRPEIEFNSISLLFYSVKNDSIEIFERAIQIITKKDKSDSNTKSYNFLLNDIIDIKRYNFYIKFIKSGLISIDNDEIVQQCIRLSNPKVYTEICHDKIPQEKEIQAFYHSIVNNNYQCFLYLLSIISINFDRFNDYIPGSDQTMLTLAIKHATDTNIVEQLLSNKYIDVNKTNKLGESPLFISLNINNSKLKLYEMIMNHEEIKFTFKDLECAINNDKKDVFEFIIKHIDHFVDDPQKIVQVIIESKSLENLKLLSSSSNSAGKEIQSAFLPIVLLYSVKNNLKSFFKSELEDKINEIDLTIEDPIKKGATALCYAVYQRGMYFFNKMKNHHPLLSNCKQNVTSKISPFGNVRSLEAAQELMRLFNEKKLSTEIIVKEVCGLNVEGQTALYSSIIENNFILFDYLLNLNNELNQKLKKEELVDALIYTKNEDGKNAFFAICMNKNWQIFINKLFDKMIQLNSKNNGYFGKFSPLTAAISSRNFKLVNILLSKGFIIDHFSFCQILKMNLWNSLGKKLIESNPDFQFDLFMPLYLINDEEKVEELFTQKKVNYNFNLNEKLTIKTDEENDDYLLLSAIRNRNEKLAELILKNCDKNYENILFDWKDSHGKTALHYAIEKSMTKIVYLFIDIFTNDKNNRFNFFFIEDDNSENSIHYLFKSFNEEYILHFYKQASSYLKSSSKIQEIFNNQSLLYKEKTNKEDEKNEVFKKLPDLLKSDNDEVNEFLNYRINNPRIIMTQRYNSINDAADQNKKINKNESSTKETLLTYSIKNNKEKFIKIILEKITEIDPNAVNSVGETPLQISIKNPTIFKTLIESCGQNNGRNDLDVNKSELPFHVLCITDSKTASFYLNLLLQCPNFDINQKKTFHSSKNDQKKEIEVSLLDLFIKNIPDFDKETQKMFLNSPKIDLNSNPEFVFKLIKSDFNISLSSVFSRINDEVIKNARTDDDEKDTIATFAAKNCKFSNVFDSLILDPRIDFINSRNAKGKSAIDILNEKGLNSVVDLLSLYQKKRNNY